MYQLDLVLQLCSFLAPRKALMNWKIQRLNDRDVNAFNHSMGLCKPDPPGMGDEAGLGMDLQSIHQVLAVVFDRLLLDRKGGSDLRVRPPRTDQGEDLALALREGFADGEGLSSRCCLNRLVERVGRCCLGDEAARTALHNGLSVLRLVVHGENKDPRRARCLYDAGDRGKPIEVRHGDIQ